MPKVPKTVDEYLASLEPDTRKALTGLRKAILAAAPKAEEKINYRIPFYRQDGHLAAFAAQKNHLSFVTMSYDVVKQFKAELKDFKVSGTTIQFYPEKTIPQALVKKIIKARIKGNKDKLLKKKK